MTQPTDHSVDSTTHPCCAGIGGHTPECDRRTPPADCTSWCTENNHRADPACWGLDRYVNLTLEDGFPYEALPERVHDFDPPRIGVHSYRGRSGYRSVAKLHLYRPSDNDYRDLDDELKLTADEARALARQLWIVADEIEGAQR